MGSYSRVKAIFPPEGGRILYPSGGGREGQHLRRFVQKMSKIHWYRYTLNIVKSKSKMEDMYLNIKSEA